MTVWERMEWGRGGAEGDKCVGSYQGHTCSTPCKLVQTACCPLSCTDLIRQHEQWKVNALNLVSKHVALRPQKRDGLLGTGTRGEGDERVKARTRIQPKKDRRDRGPPPEQ